MYANISSQTKIQYLSQTYFVPAPVCCTKLAVTVASDWFVCVHPTNDLPWNGTSIACSFCVNLSPFSIHQLTPKEICALSYRWRLTKQLKFTDDFKTLYLKLKKWIKYKFVSCWWRLHCFWQRKGRMLMQTYKKKQDWIKHAHVELLHASVTST